MNARQGGRGRTVAAILVTLCLVSLTGGIPAAGLGNPVDTGVLSGGILTVGDTHDGQPCANGTPDRFPDGEGMYIPGFGPGGFPSALGPRILYWHLESGVVSTTDGAGTVEACGKLGPFEGIGAACGISNGIHGYGVMTFFGGGKHSAVWLKYVKWVLTVGGTVPVEAEVWEAGKTGGEPVADLFALAQAQGGQACTGAAGAQQFTFAGVYAYSP